MYQTHSHRTAASGYSQDPRPFWLHGQNLRAWGPDKSSWSWIYRINIGFPYVPVLLCLVLWHGFLDSAVHRLPLAWTTPAKPPLSRQQPCHWWKRTNDCHVPITMNLGSERASGSDSGRSKSLTNQFASHKSCRESTCRAAAQLFHTGHNPCVVSTFTPHIRYICGELDHNWKHVIVLCYYSCKPDPISCKSRLARQKTLWYATKILFCCAVFSLQIWTLRTVMRQ